MEKLALYIHIPFCKSKCHYCDFNSYSNIDYLMVEYIDALILEMQLYKEKLRGNIISTIFIGGGTPTYLNEELLEKILGNCFKIFNVENNCEISIEANPGTLSYKKLKTLKQNGINRLSIGLQTWNDEQLKKIGRTHTNYQFIKNFNEARKIGFNNISIDLIYSLPGQTMKEWDETLDNVIKINPEHVSCYGLILEEGTKMYDDYINHRIQLVDEDTDRDMHHHAIKVLNEKGYNHYEISNFAKKGFECKHNLVYWESEQYIGLGAGAHSHINDVRYSNIWTPDKYIKEIEKKQFAIQEKTYISKQDKMSEYMFLNLRLSQGVNIKKFNYIFGTDLNYIFGKEINKFIKQGLLKKECDNYKLTARGIDISNQVFLEFI